MSVNGSLDALAVRAETMAGLKRCYAATGGGISDTLRPIPRGIEDGPVGVVWMGSAEGNSGNAEHLIFRPVLDIWVQAENAGFAYKTLVAFPDLARTAMRGDLTLNGECTRCEFVGWDDPTTETINDRTYLVLPILFEVLITRYAAEAVASQGPSFDSAFSGDFI